MKAIISTMNPLKLFSRFIPQTTKPIIIPIKPSKSRMISFYENISGKTRQLQETQELLILEKYSGIIGSQLNQLN